MHPLYSCHMELLEAREKVKELQNKFDKLRSELSLECPACKGRHRICDLCLIQTYYTEDSDPYAGPQTHVGERQFICPKVGDIVRLLFSYKYGEDKWKSNEFLFFKEYRELFKEKINEKVAPQGARFYISRYIDQNMKKFLIPCS